MKVYKVEVCIIDHDDLGEKEIKAVLEETRYPNHCMYPDVIQIEGREIGEWSDDHPLNSRKTFLEEYHRLFSEER